MIYRQRLLRSPAAPVAALLITLGATNASALSMGKLRVQSALGQNLIAEIDLADINDDEAGSLKSELAAPSTFVGMGLEYNNALNGTQVALQRRQNGTRYLKITGSRALNDPFVDILVELSWASGKIVRTYTILLDPPKPQDLSAPPMLPAPVLDSQSAATKITAPAAVNATATTSPQVPTTTASNKAAANTALVAAGASIGPQRVKVNPGDNAGKIARAWASEGVTTEQMLVAMLNANPAAFAGGNVNRLLANSEIVAPEIATVKKTSQIEAQGLIQRQNQDFQNLRRTLAGQVPVAASSPNPTESAGKVTTAAPAAAPKAPSGDTLKLSKGSSQDIAEKANMEQIAQQRAKNEATERARELAKNIEELNQLAKVAAKPDPAASAAAPSEPMASSASQGGTAASAALAASTPVAPAIVATAPAPVKAPAGWFESVTRNPDLGALLLALIGLLGGFSWYRRGKAKKSGGSRLDAGSKWNSSASTSFAVGGAQSVDTSEANVSALHNSIYQESQLEMANELDPVAEAEVYLAYGKDVPAEEILKEGLQQTPNRVAIHLKLLSIYAKRGDTNSFESMARDVKSLTQASGSDWGQVLEMGLALEPTNPLYNTNLAKAPDEVETVDTFQPSTLDLEPEDLKALAITPDNTGDDSKRLDPPSANEPLFVSPSSESTAPQANASFDLGSISLTQPAALPESAFATTERLDATLALAEQFLEIGEKEGALALIDEVMASGNETLRKRASDLLAKAQ